MSEKEELLANWQRRVRMSQYAHYIAARNSRRAHMMLGLPAVIIPTIVGTTLFALIGDEIGYWITATLGALCVSSAVLAAIQVFFKFDSRAELHLAAAAQYGSVRRQIELLLINEGFSGESFNEELERLVTQLDSIAKESPPLSASIWRQAEAEIHDSDLSYRHGLTPEESIVAGLNRYGSLPIDFLASTQNLTHKEVLMFVESLRKRGLVDVEDGRVSLRKGGAH